MAHLEFSIKIKEELSLRLSPNKAKLIEAISAGYSNKYIAEAFGVSLKAIEQNFTELNKQLGTRDELYNSRMRIISALISEDLAEYQSESKYSEVVDLSEILKQTLLLTAIGLSTQAIAQMLQVSVKTIEQRLGQLYDYFGIDTRSLDDANPRVILVIAALLKGNISEASIKRLHKETSLDRLKRILQQPEYFVQKLNRPQTIIS